MYFRNLLLLLSILSTLSAGIIQAKESVTTEYFAGMSGVISPFLEYHPVLPVSKDEAVTIGHYRVKKDRIGRLKEIAWFDKQVPSNNSYFVTHKVVYSYPETGGYSRHYIDADGKPAKMWRHYYQGGDIHEERYSRSGNQRFVSLYNTEGEKIESDIGAHHFTATLLDERRFLQTQENLSGAPVVFRKAMPFMSVIVSVDGDGFLDKVLNVDPETLQPTFDQTVGYAALKVNFDENGLELGWEYQDETGSLVNLPDNDDEAPGAAFTVWFKQWHNQRLNQWSQIWGRYYDKTGAVVTDKKGVYLLHYRKDHQNRIAEIAYYNANGGLHFVEADGFARKEFHYDNAQSQRVEKRFDADNRLLTDR